MKQKFLGGVFAAALLLVSVGGVTTAFALEDGAEPRSVNTADVKSEQASDAGAEVNALDIGTDKTFIDFGFAKEVGRSYTSELVVRNKGSEAAKVKLNVARYKEECAEESRKGEEWLVFVGGKNYLEIPAGEEAKVKLRFNVPKDAERDRSQYAMVEVRANDVVYAEVAVKISILGENDERSFNGDVKDVDANFVGLSDKLIGKATVENNGRMGYGAKLKVRVSPAFGLENWRDVYEGEVELAPGAKVNFGYEDSIGYGVFQVEQVINYVNHEGKAVVMTNMRRVVLLPEWTPFVAVGVAVAIILVIVVVKSIKKKKAKNKKQSSEPENMSSEGEGPDVDDGGAKQVSETQTEKVEENLTLTDIWGDSEVKM